MSWKPPGHMERKKIKNRGKAYQPNRDKMVRGHEKGFRAKKT